jgi:hypothetical protein
LNNVDVRFFFCRTCHVPLPAVLLAQEQTRHTCTQHKSVYLKDESMCGHIALLQLDMHYQRPDAMYAYSTTFAGIEWVYTDWQAIRAWAAT